MLPPTKATTHYPHKRPKLLLPCEAEEKLNILK